MRPSAAAGSAMPTSIVMAGTGSRMSRTSLIHPGVRCSASILARASARTGWNRSTAWRKAYVRHTKIPAFQRCPPSSMNVAARAASGFSSNRSTSAGRLRRVQRLADLDVAVSRRRVVGLHAQRDEIAALRGLGRARAALRERPRHRRHGDRPGGRSRPRPTRDAPGRWRGLRPRRSSERAARRARCPAAGAGAGPAWRERAPRW